MTFLILIIRVSKFPTFQHHTGVIIKGMSTESGTDIYMLNNQNQKVLDLNPIPAPYI